MIVPSYIPTNSIRGFPFLHTLFSIYYLQTSWWQVLTTVRRLSQCSFDLHFCIRVIEHHFLRLLAICMPSLEECLCRPLVYSLIGLFVFLILSSMNCLIVLEISPLSVPPFAIIFSQSVGVLFVLLLVSFATQKLLSLTRFQALLLLWFLFPWETDLKNIAATYVRDCSAYLLVVLWCRVLSL